MLDFFNNLNETDEGDNLQRSGTPELPTKNDVDNLAKNIVESNPEMLQMMEGIAKGVEALQPSRQSPSVRGALAGMTPELVDTEPMPEQQLQGLPPQEPETVDGIDASGIISNLLQGPQIEGLIKGELPSPGKGLMGEVASKGAQGLGLGLGVAAVEPTMNALLGLAGKLGTVQRDEPIKFDEVSQTRAQQVSGQLMEGGEELAKKIVGQAATEFKPQEDVDITKVKRSEFDLEDFDVDKWKIKDRGQIVEILSLKDAFKQLEDLESKIDFRSLGAGANLYEVTKLGGQLQVKTPEVFKDPMIQEYQQVVKLAGNQLLKALQGTRASDQDAIRIFQTFFGQGGMSDQALKSLVMNRRSELEKRVASLSPSEQAFANASIIQPQIKEFVNKQGGRVRNGLVKFPAEGGYMVLPVEKFADYLQEQGIELDRL